MFKILANDSFRFKDKYQVICQLKVILPKLKSAVHDTKGVVSAKKIYNLNIYLFYIYVSNFDLFRIQIKKSGLL